MLGERMEAEMREQPALLAENWERYDKSLRDFLPDTDFDLVLLVARGSSDNAALYARYLIEIHLHIPVVLAAPSVLSRYGSHIRYPRALAVGISQSGAGPDVAEVLADLRKTGHKTLAITNTPGSLITETAENSLLLGLGEERAVAATKTYSASLLALYCLCRALGADLPNPRLPDAAWVSECEEKANEDFMKLAFGGPLFSLARGIRFCSAEEAGLKLMECALLPCLAYSLADFEHGPKALASDRAAAIVFGTPPDSWKDKPVRVAQAPERAGIAEAEQPFWDAIYAQWLALLAARAQGLDPDRPENLSKVTQTR